MDGEKMKAIQLLLKDQPYNYYQRWKLANPEERRWRVIKKSLLDWEEDAAFKNIRESKMMSCKQGSRPLDEYINELEKYFNEFNPPDKTQRLLLTSGLEPGLRKHLMKQRNINSYDEAVKEVKLEDAVEGTLVVQGEKKKCHN